MKELEERILKEGRALNEDVLKVDSFLNHQVDPELMKKIGQEFANYFANRNINKVITIESSGIAPALATAMCLNVPLVICKKQTSKILTDDFFQTEVKSFTKNSSYELTISKKYLSSDDNVLVIDDFLANGEASKGALRVIEMANAKCAGIGIVIEKSFQPGRKLLDELGIDVYSLARVKKLSEGVTEFFN